MPSESTARLLLVDDLETNRFLLEEALQEMGLDIISAESGERAIEIVRERSPDIVLLDLQMPGLDGAETSRRIRELRGGQLVYVLLISGYGESEKDAVLGRSLADRFLAKPYTLDELRLAVRQGLSVAARRKRDKG